MRIPPHLWILASGLALGAVAHGAFRSGPKVESALQPTKVAIRPPAVAAPGLLPSSDTLEILKDPKLPDQMARVALWLPHASLEEVQAFWDSLEEHPASDELKILVLARWVALDPAGALKTRGEGIGSIPAWEAWAYWDPRAAHQAALDSGDSKALVAVMQVLATRDPDYVLKLLDDGAVNPRVARRVVDGFLAQRSYERALEVSLRFGGSSDKGKIYSEWAKQDPLEALKWGSRQPDLVELLNGDDVIMRDIARQQGSAIPEILGKLPSGKIKGRLEEAYARDLAAKDPAAAIRFASEAKAPLTRDYLLGSIGIVAAATQPDAAAEVFTKLLDSGRSLGEHPVMVFFPDGPRKWSSTRSPLDGFGKALAEHMPEKALDTAMLGADKPAYQKAALQLAGMLMERDAWDFGGWLDRQPASETRDQMIQQFSSHLVSGREPAYAEALSWAAATSDVRQRDAQLSQLIARWKSKDPAACQRYLADPATPEAVRALSTPSESR
ncbi:MAG TPA: hypothetical protein VGE67_14380 [Haloferula sp.]